MSQEASGVVLPGRAWAEARQGLKALWTLTPKVLFGLRLWIAVCLALYVAFWLELDRAYWAGVSAAASSCPITTAATAAAESHHRRPAQAWRSLPEQRRPPARNGATRWRYSGEQA